jgi:hypothetical protein
LFQLKKPDLTGQLIKITGASIYGTTRGSGGHRGYYPYQCALRLAGQRTIEDHEGVTK